MLPSFHALRQKNLDTLYGTSCSPTDRSPKGSVDEHIQNLVDCINHHPHYVTLSSCSGRIALFDPSEESTTNEREPSVAATNGKGANGSWLLVSHDPIDPSVLLSFLQNKHNNSVECPDSSSPPCFLFEPLLLHVAAASLQHGQEMLHVALAAGLRESGLIVTDTRVTVALRTQGLRLVVPVLWNTTVIDTTYWTTVVNLANQRLHRNWELLQRVHSAMERMMYPDMHMSIQTSLERVIPNLKLYGHSGAVLGNDTVVVLGGYGPGPCVKGPNRRSDAVYHLEMGKSVWTRMDVPLSSDTTTCLQTSKGPLRVQSCAWTARQGLTSVACGDTLALIFGGRHGPADPLSDLLIYDSTNTRFYQVMDVRGDKPSPRWGHTLTTLQAESTWLLVGGRNSSTVVEDSVYLGCLEHDEESGAFFSWTKLTDVSIPPVFHHATVALDETRVFIFGGLQSVNSIVSSHLAVVLTLKKDSAAQQMLLDTKLYRFGHQMNLIKKRTSAIAWILVSGGVCPSSKDPILTCFQLTTKKTSVSLDVVPTKLLGKLEDFGVLVHHCSLQVSPGRIAVCGGGVSGFAFPDAFASSQMLAVDVHHNTEPNNASIIQDAPHSQVPSDPIERVYVLYYLKRDAKTAKESLNNVSLLDKNYRITSVDTTCIQETIDGEVFSWAQYIAIPITSCVSDWRDRGAVGVGKQECPLSTRRFARGKK